MIYRTVSLPMNLTHTFQDYFRYWILLHGHYLKTTAYITHDAPNKKSVSY